MADFLVGVRHGAADRVALEKAGLRLVFETFEDFGEDPHRHYVCVAADDESEARARIIAALGWNDVAPADVVTRQPHDRARTIRLRNSSRSCRCAATGD